MTQALEKHQVIIYIGGMPYTFVEASQLARNAYVSKKFQAALDACDAIIAQIPNQAEIYINRGSILQELKRHEEALASYDKAIALKPDYAEAYNSKGVTLQQLKRPEEALDCFRKAILLKPDFVAAYQNQSAALRALKRYDDVLASCNKALALQPDHHAYYNRGIALHHLKRFEEALDSYKEAIDLKPDYAAAYHNQGLTLYTMKKYDEALKSYDEAIACKPNYSEAFNNRGLALQQLKRYDEALEDFQKAIDLRPGYIAAYHNKGAILRKLMRYGEALANCDNAIATTPFADAYNHRGDILVSLGRMEEAEQMFIKALEMNPNFAAPLCCLTGIRKYKDAGHEDIKNMKAFLKKPNIPLQDSEMLHFGLGKAYDDCELYDEAFEHYRQANQICNAKISYAPDKITAFTSSLIEVFSSEFLSQKFSYASDNPSPLFVLGMPRSGTTLMASILSNHPSIRTAGELPILLDVTGSIQQLTKNPAPYPHAVKHLSADMASEVIQKYETRIRRDISMDIPYVIDKHPFNFKLLGFIAMLFPKAKIIHCVRNPMDTCLSNYFQRFALEYNYSFDLRNIGNYYKEYAKLMAHWQKTLPLEILEINYEDTILDQEQVIHRALDFLGLEWDERCLTPHTNPCIVETASKWQVRQPIYTQSLERWKHYEKHLMPLKVSLESA